MTTTPTAARTTTTGLMLRRPSPRDATLVSQWSRSCADTDEWFAPVSDDVVLGWWEQPDVEPWLAVTSEGVPVGYGELWIDPPEDEVELARLIIAPGHRGRGLGREMVAALRDKAALTGQAAIILRFKPGNEVGRRCYLASGFRELDAARRAEWNQGQPVDYVWMEIVS